MKLPIIRFCLATFVLLVAGMIAGSAQTLSACANNVSGQLRLLTPPDTCKISETQVNWGIHGPPGPTGPQGIQGVTGATGATGASGVSRVYSYSSFTEVLLPQASFTVGSPLASLDLPAGNYSVTAKISLRTGLAPGSIGDYPALLAGCNLAKGPDIIFLGPDLLDSSSLATIVPGGSSGFGDVLTLTSTLNLATSGVAQLRCTRSSDMDVSANIVKLTALQVDEIITQ